MDRMACINLPVFKVQLLLRRYPDWRNQPVAVVDVNSGREIEGLLMFHGSVSLVLRDDLSESVSQSGL